MMDSVYIETTVVGHLAGRVYRDPVVAVRQMVTRAWWQNDSSRFRLYISQLVLDECGDGDPSAAAERLLAIETIDILAVTPEVDLLADALIAGKAVPTS